MEKKPTHAKPQLYAYYFLQLKEIAKDFGYNLVVHGSMNRDLDLIAVPWTDEPKPELDLIHELHRSITGYAASPESWKDIYMFKELPGGRRSYVINVNRRQTDGNGNYQEDPQYYIDISLIPAKPKSPKKIAYCGSLRVALDAFKKAEYQSVLDGNIALLPCCMFVDIQREYGAESDYKQKADDLHKRKIDICDEVFVLNVNGYIGDSTRSEIEYANSIGKPVLYLEPLRVGEKN